MLASWDAALGAKGGQGVASATASAASSSLPTEALAASLALLCVWRVRVAWDFCIAARHCSARLLGSMQSRFRMMLLSAGSASGFGRRTGG